ncbi:MAG: hypothetical protein COA78_23005 [Blastopirellula sp.]|nr:MAG: hypothetical protein COA78_23005 [Blastopirellula sp.]
MANSLLQNDPIDRADFEESLMNSPNKYYVILDSCDESFIQARVLQEKERFVCLYRGDAKEKLWHIAPYLAQFDQELLDWVTTILKGTPWGIVLEANADLEAMRKHLRHFLMVDLPDEGEVYFRYYDPRVIPTYIETCTANELDEFYGPIRSIFYLEDLESDTFTRLSPVHLSGREFD